MFSPSTLVIKELVDQSKQKFEILHLEFSDRFVAESKHHIK